MSERKKKNADQKLEALFQKEKYLEVINSFATSLIEAETIDEILWTVTKQAIAKLDYYDCVIYLYDRKLNKLIQRSAYGPKSPKDLELLNPQQISPGEGIVGTVFKTGIGEIVGDTSKDARYIVDDAPRLSEITIPLVHKGKIIGVIDSEHPEKNFFTEQDFKMLSTVAAMLSTKIEQAKSNDELRKYQINLEKLIAKKTKELKESNNHLLAKNKEKEVLIKEIHHRVKNNMQIIISLLNIQANSAISERESTVFNECKNRIRSMALIHERLYIEKDITKILLNEYVEDLCKDLSYSYTNAPVNFIIKVEAIKTSIDTAIPVGLILNEMITNSLKHAFKKKDDGKISITSTTDDKTMTLNIEDNGCGFDYNNYNDETFGLELMRILVSQINGTLTYSNQNGSHFKLIFPI